MQSLPADADAEPPPKLGQSGQVAAFKLDSPDEEESYSTLPP